MRWIGFVALSLLLAACGDASRSDAARDAMTQAGAADTTAGGRLLSEQPTTARAADGRYISWREHRIDDELKSDGLDYAFYIGDWDTLPAAR